MRDFEISRQDQVSLPIVIRATISGLPAGLKAAGAAILFGAIVSGGFGGRAVPGNRWTSAALGFVLLFALILAMIIVGHLFPPPVRIHQNRMLIGEDEEICRAQVRLVCYERLPGIARFEIEYEAASRTETHCFAIAERENTEP